MKQHPILPVQPTLHDLQKYVAAVIAHRGFEQAFRVKEEKNKQRVWQ